MSDRDPELSDRSFNLREWHRIESEKKIAGVAAGIADQLGLPITLVRAAFVLATLYSGVGVAVYLILWFLMPGESGSTSGLDRLVASVSDLAGDSSRREHRRERRIEEPDDY